MKHREHKLSIGFLLAAAIVATLSVRVDAYNGPSTSAGSGSGALGVGTSSNISIGTSSTDAATKLFIVGSSTATTAFIAKFVDSSQGPILYVRNDGSLAIGTTSFSGGSVITVNGTIFSTGGLSGTVSASNVTANVFGAGSFAFPSSLGINTSTQVSLPNTLTVYGTAQVTGASTLGGAVTQSGGVVSLASTTIGGNATTTNLTISGLGTSGSNCLTVGSTGVVATTTCGGALSGGTNNFFALWTGASTLSTTTLQKAANSIVTTSGFAVGTTTDQAAGNVYINGNVTTTNITISGLGTSGSNCLTVGSTGVVATTTCGGGALSGGQTNYIPVWTSASALGTSTLIQSGSNVGIGTANPSSTLHVIGDVLASGNLYGGSKPMPFVFENPTASEDDAIFVFNTTSTITKVYAVSKTTGDTVTFNIVWAASRATASSSAQHLFSSNQAVTATTTPTTLTTFASSTVNPGSVMRFVTSAASSSQFTLTLYYRDSPQ